MVMVSLLHSFQEIDGEKKNEYVGATQPTAGGSLYHHTQNKGSDVSWIPAPTVHFVSPLSVIR